MGMNRPRPTPVQVPQERKTTFQLTNSGKFTEADVTISREGLFFESPNNNCSGSSNSPHPNASGKTEDSNEPSSSTQCSGQPSTSELTLEDLEDMGVIGSGTSGIAKKVRNKHTGGMLVLKVIQFDVSSDTVRKQVLTELRTLHGASHENIVKYHQAFFDNGAIIIVMEYCDGGSLMDVLRAAGKTRPGQGIPEHFVAELARQVVAGLLHLHKGLRVVHRDIKPSNLLLNSKGNCKISDFGVSGQLTNSVSNCQSWVGTVTYMSPERINGDAYSFDSDMWSLGLTLVECALGRYPYPPPGQNPPAQPLGFWELLEYIVHEPPPVLCPEDGFSPELCDFVSQCLVKETHKRPNIEALSKHPFLQMYKDLEDGLAGLLSYAMGSDAVRAEAEAEAAAENEGKKAATSSRPCAQ